MNKVYLALGSNIGNSVTQINRAIELLGAYITDIKKAPVYSTKPVGYTDQANFINTVIGGQTALDPQELLIATNNTEAEVGRTKQFHWGPREIDIDIVFFNDQIIETDTLNVPHPSFRERDFVLQPLVDLNSSLIDPLTKKTVRQLLDELNPQELSIINKL